MKIIEIFVDGSCLKNPGPGGYGIVIKNKNFRKELSNGYYLTTNNRMELMSVIKALEIIKNINYIKIYTDSLYVKLGITIWIKKWMIKYWKSSKNKNIKNIDLWKRLFLLIKNCKINWNWIKSHSGILDNEICDQLAKKAALNPKIIDENYINYKN